MVIIYLIESEAQSLCDRLISCKSASDTVYSKPVKRCDKNEWFVQVLDKDLSHLTSEEFSSRVDLPNDWFPTELV